MKFKILNLLCVIINFSSRSSLQFYNTLSKMNIRNVMKINLDFKSLWIKLLLRQKGCQYNNFPFVKYLRLDNDHNVHQTQVFGKNVFPVTSKIQSWKWLLAISLVYAGYDNLSKQEALIIVFYLKCFKSIVFCIFKSNKIKCS